MLKVPNPKCHGERVKSAVVKRLKKWVPKIGLDSAIYAAHSMRGTKSCLIYKCTKNLRAVQLLLGHTKLESTVKHLDIEVEGALEIAEKTEI